MKKIYTSIIILALANLGFAQTQETTTPSTTTAVETPKEPFKPSGAPIVLVFSNFHSSIGKLNNGDNVNASAFEITRGYLGYKYNFSENFSANIIGNFSDVGAATYSQIGYLQYAELIYTNNKFTGKFGLIKNRQFDVQEAFWGHRYILQSLQDYRFGIASSDRGICGQYDFNNMISADLTIRNSEGYKLAQKDDVYRGGIGLTLKPIDGLTIRGYYDYYNNISTVAADKGVGHVVQSSIATFVGYKFADKGSIGFEYDLYNNVGNYTDKNLTGISIYGSYNLTSKFELFGRFDNVSSNSVTVLNKNANWNTDGVLDKFSAGSGFYKNGSYIADGSTVVGGVQYAPVTGVKLALDYQQTSYVTKLTNDAKPLQLIYLNVEFKF